MYLSDPEACFEIEQSNTADVILERFVRWLPLQVKEPRDYLRGDVDAIVIDTQLVNSKGPRSWLPICGKYADVPLSKLHQSRDFALYRHRPERPPTELAEQRQATLGGGFR